MAVIGSPPDHKRLVPFSTKELNVEDTVSHPPPISPSATNGTTTTAMIIIIDWMKSVQQTALNPPENVYNTMMNPVMMTANS